MELVQALLQTKYRFVTNWQVKGKVNEVFEILKNAENLPSWWPAVYLNTDVLKPGDKNGIGQIVDLFSKGWLPYTLSWLIKITEVQKANLIKFESWGDLSGEGTWKLKQNGEFVDIIFDWRVKLEKPIFRYFSGLLKPIFEANYKWAMDKGLLSLKLELARKNAKTPQELKKIPAPPKATSSSMLPLYVALAGGFAVSWTFIRLLNSVSKKTND